MGTNYRRKNFFTLGGDHIRHQCSPKRSSSKLERISRSTRNATMPWMRKLKKQLGQLSVRIAKRGPMRSLKFWIVLLTTRNRRMRKAAGMKREESCQVCNRAIGRRLRIHLKR